MPFARNRRRPCSAPLMGMLLAGAVCAPALAQHGPTGRSMEAQHHAMRAEFSGREGSRDEGRSLSDAVRRVQRSTGGHILGAERVPFDGRAINRVKYMDDRGRVRYMDDPVQTRSQPRPPRSDISSLRNDNP